MLHVLVFWFWFWVVVSSSFFLIRVLERKRIRVYCCCLIWFWFRFRVFSICLFNRCVVLGLKKVLFVCICKWELMVLNIGVYEHWGFCGMKKMIWFLWREFYFIFLIFFSGLYEDWLRCMNVMMKEMKEEEEEIRIFFRCLWFIISNSRSLHDPMVSI